MTPHLDPEATPDWVVAEATIHLPGFGRGQVRLVDRSDPYIARMIEKTYLYVIDPDPDLGE